jgi:hypothetical protein
MPYINCEYNVKFAEISVLKVLMVTPPPPQTPMTAQEATVQDLDLHN